MDAEATLGRKQAGSLWALGALRCWKYLQEVGEAALRERGGPPDLLLHHHALPVGHQSRLWAWHLVCRVGISILETELPGRRTCARNDKCHHHQLLHTHLQQVTDKKPRSSAPILTWALRPLGHGRQGQAQARGPHLLFSHDPGNQAHRSLQNHGLWEAVRRFPSEPKDW